MINKSQAEEVFLILCLDLLMTRAKTYRFG
jgi:hypothetical protein